MRALVPAVLMLLLAAGCVSPADPNAGLAGTGNGPASLVCLDTVCNFVATPEPDREGNELSVAVNPTNPLNIIATAKDYTPDEAGDCVWAGVYATLDGGKTWTTQNVPGSPWKRLKDPTLPVTPFTKFWCATDPVVAFGPDGTAYWTVMPYQCDPLTGSKTGRGVIPGSPVTGGGGGMNDWAWSCSAMYVLVSDDGGITWPLDKARMVAEGPRLVHDKQWLAVSPSGDTVVLCWDYQGGGSISPGDPPYHAPSDYGVVCSVSNDKGDSWSRFEYASTVGAYPWIEFGPDGRVWMVLTDGFAEGRFLVLSSEDGLAWSEPVEVATFVNADGVNDHGWPALEGSMFRIVPVASLAVDRSGGPYSGRIYVSYFDHAPGHGETMVAWSDDGVTWSAPVRVNDDVGEADQFMPVVSVGPDGTVDVSWQDRRDDPENHLFHTYYAYSVDGGVTYSANLRVTDVASDEQHSHHQNGMIFLGDYRDSDSTAGRATFTWVDTRNEKADVMVATVQRPGAAAPVS